MASVVQICNMALSHIGSEALVTSISPPDGSVEAGLCAVFYDQARSGLIEPGAWNFAIKRQALAAVTNGSTVWAYAYAKPSDCLRPLRILRPTPGITVFTQDSVMLQADDRDSADFDVEGDVIYSNEPDAVLVYTTDVTDTSKFPPSFTAALSFALASYLAGPIIKGNEGAKLGDAMRQRAMSASELAATAGANVSSVSSNEHATSLVAIRA